MAIIFWTIIGMILIGLLLGLVWRAPNTWIPDPWKWVILGVAVFMMIVLIGGWFFGWGPLGGGPPLR